MIKILFICHGNICRSTMAQFVFQDMVNHAGLADEFFIDSKATSTEEIGNPPHRGTVRKMNELGIPMQPHFASQVTKSDYNKFDYIIGMDKWNYKNMMRIFFFYTNRRVIDRNKFVGSGRDVAGPCYTRKINDTYRYVKEGCEALLDKCVGEIKA